MKGIKIAALGDSLTKGVILTDKEKYSLVEFSFMDIISSTLNIHVDNYSRFGCTVSFGEKMIERHKEKISSSDYTFIEYGGNDCDFDWLKIAESPSEEHAPKTEIKTFKEHIIKLINSVKELGSKPILLSLPPILSDRYFSFFSRTMTQEHKDNVVNWLGGDIGIISRWHECYNRELFKIASLTNTEIIDITSPFDTYRGHLSALYCSDGIHPNAEGHKLIAGEIVSRYM